MAEKPWACLWAARASAMAFWRRASVWRNSRSCWERVSSDGVSFGAGAGGTAAGASGGGGASAGAAWAQAGWKVTADRP